MRFTKGVVLVTSVVLLAAGSAFADKAAEVAAQLSKPWSLADLPELAPTLADVNETEPLNNTCPGEPYNLGDIVHASLTAGDLDWFAFNATQNHLITVGTDFDGNPTADTYISLIRSDCVTALAHDDDGGPGLFSLISNFPAPYTGVYYVRVRGYSATTTGLYRFVGNVVPPPDTVCPIENYKGQKFDQVVTVPDNAPAGVTIGPIVFPDDGSVIADVVVDLGMAHTWVGDLIVRLTHIGPGGSVSVDLLNRPGVPQSTYGCSSNLIGSATAKYYFGTGNLLVLGESACPQPSIPLQCYAVAPENPNGLLPFRGRSKAGEWWLFVSDNAAGDLGTVYNFSVHLLNEGPVAVDQASWGSVKASYR